MTAACSESKKFINIYNMTHIVIMKITRKINMINN